MITRTQYMLDSDKLHHAYYMQFCNSTTKQIVERITKKGKIHWWSIPLAQWDDLHVLCRASIDPVKFQKIDPLHNFTNPRQIFWSLSDTVCTLKAQARQLYGDKPKGE
jgi:hypothetical protein